MQVPFEAYAEDCSFTGELALSGDRLSDFLASTDEFEVLNLTCRALDDGRVVEAMFAPVMRDDLCLVIAGEPRGREDMRIWTRQYPVLATVGPYVVRGYVHAPPTIDPLKLPNRRTIVAVTSGSIAYADGGIEVKVEAATVLLNSAKIERFETVLPEELERDDMAPDEAPGTAPA